MWEKALVNMEWYALRLVLACLCGAVVGYERKRRHKDAGIRTHVLVSLGAALFTIVSEFGFSDPSSADRVAANVVTGIGFLGAGVIFLRGRSITGLTTAAGIWTMAGIGMAVGSGLYALGLLATALVVLLQIVMHRALPNYENMGHWQITLRLRPDATTEMVYNVISQVPGVEIQSFQVSRRTEEGVQMKLNCQSPSALDLDAIVKMMNECPDVLEIKG